MRCSHVPPILETTSLMADAVASDGGVPVAEGFLRKAKKSPTSGAASSSGGSPGYIGVPRGSGDADGGTSAGGVPRGGGRRGLRNKPAAPASAPIIKYKTPNVHNVCCSLRSAKRACSLCCHPISRGAQSSSRSRCHS
jgi:hypothetical protein